MMRVAGNVELPSFPFPSTSEEVEPICPAQPIQGSITRARSLAMVEKSVLEEGRLFELEQT